jgi:Putative DNA-binding domain
VNDWPVSEEALRALIRSREARNIEFKQQAHEFTTNTGKGEFIKDVLALANCSTPELASYLLFGVQDPGKGNEVPGISQMLDRDRLSQLISEYTEPVPDFRIDNLSFDGKTIGVVGLFWTESFPYFSRRDLGSLHVGVGYTRRDGIVGRMTPTEIEFHYRAKAARLGPLLIQEPLECGFVDAGHWSGPNGPVLRVSNVSDSIVRDVDIVFDVWSKADPSVFRRNKAYDAGSMGPGTSKQAELHLELGYFYPQAGNILSDPAARKWLEVLARIRYRDRYGLLKEIQTSTFLVD